MEQGKSKNSLIAFLILIISILVVLFVLLANGTISFKNNKNLGDGNDIDDDYEYDLVRYYQYYRLNQDGSHTIYELELSSDWFAKYCVSDPNSGSFCEEGRFRTDGGNRLYFYDYYYKSGEMPSDDQRKRTFVILDKNTYDKIYEESAKDCIMTLLNKEKMQLIFGGYVANDDLSINILSMDKPSIHTGEPNHVMSISGTMKLSFNGNKYIVVDMTGFCYGANGEKYSVYAPASGGEISLHNGESTYTLVETVGTDEDVIYADGTKKSWEDIDWNNVTIKSCEIVNLNGYTASSGNEPAITKAINYKKEFN